MSGEQKMNGGKRARGGGMSPAQLETWVECAEERVDALCFDDWGQGGYGDRGLTKRVEKVSGLERSMTRLGNVLLQLSRQLGTVKQELLGHLLRERHGFGVGDVIELPDRELSTRTMARGAVLKVHALSSGSACTAASFFSATLQVCKKDGSLGKRTRYVSNQRVTDVTVIERKTQEVE